MRDVPSQNPEEKPKDIEGFKRKHQLAYWRDWFTECRGLNQLTDYINRNREIQNVAGENYQLEIIRIIIDYTFFQTHYNYKKKSFRDTKHRGHEIAREYIIAYLSHKFEAEAEPSELDFTNFLALWSNKKIQTQLGEKPQRTAAEIWQKTYIQISIYRTQLDNLPAVRATLMRNKMSGPNEKNFGITINIGK
jgi:hypothetical protein